jgi:hypothetical protein
MLSHVAFQPLMMGMAPIGSSRRMVIRLCGGVFGWLGLEVGRYSLVAVSKAVLVCPARLQLLSKLAVFPPPAGLSGD